MKFDAVLFDAAETLFTTRGSVGEIYANVAREFGSTASPSDIQAAFEKHFPRTGPLSTDNEKHWWKDIVHRVFTEVGLMEKFDVFFDRIYDLFRDSRGWMLFPETRDVLESLRERGFKLGVVSNFDSRLYTVLKDLRILQFFDAVTICSETGFAKPQPEIFRAAATSLKVRPDRALYTGDSLVDDFVAGRDAGLETWLLDRSDRYAAMKSVRRIGTLRDVLTIVELAPKS